MKPSPHDEVPRSPVPQASQKHRYNQVDVRAELPLAVPSHRNVQIIAEPRRKGYVPAMPEIGHAVRLVWRIEVDGETEAQQQGKPDCHIAVPRKVAINLQRIAIYPEQVFQSRIQTGIIEDALHEIDADVIGYDRLLEQTAHDKEDTLPEHLVGNPKRLVYLRHEIAGTHNGTRTSWGKNDT